MKIVLKEEIILSEKEREAFELVEKVLEEVMRECKTHDLGEICGKGLDRLYEFSDYVDSYMED